MKIQQNGNTYRIVPNGANILTMEQIYIIAPWANFVSEYPRYMTNILDIWP